ncbi:MAG: hypothetical protein QXT26_05565 [Thermoproteota archaeon]
MSLIEYVIAGVMISVLSAVILLNIRARNSTKNGIRIENMIEMLRDDVNSRFTGIECRISAIEQRLLNIERKLMGG